MSQLPPQPIRDALASGQMNAVSSPTPLLGAAIQSTSRAGRPNISPADQLRDRIVNKSWTAAVHGLGYVGLPLAVAIAEQGTHVIGFDVSSARTRNLNSGRSHVEDVRDDVLQYHLAQGSLRISDVLEETTAADVVIIAVPTPADGDGEPDLSFINAASKNVATAARPAQLISLESTTFPGTTREVVASALRRAGHEPGEDVFVTYSPERINPGDRTFDLGRIPKVVGGLDPTSTELGVLVYEQFVTQVHAVASAEVAEMTKLIENVFRGVNIALINEMAMLCHELQIDVWNVVGAASTKPFGFLPHYPGPGVGGHCIPVDPAYLVHRARQVNSRHTTLIEAATRVNGGMPLYVVERLNEALTERGQPLAVSNILVLGASYKPGTGDLRESPAVRILQLLQQRAACVTYHDPVVPEIPTLQLQSRPITPDLLTWADGVVLVTDQQNVDLELVFSSGKYVLDSRDAFRSRGLVGPHIEPL